MPKTNKAKQNKTSLLPQGAHKLLVVTVYI